MQYSIFPLVRFSQKSFRSLEDVLALVPYGFVIFVLLWLRSHLLLLIFSAFNASFKTYDKLKL